MIRFFLAFLFTIQCAFASAPIIWGPNNTSKFLQQNFNIADVASVLVGTIDPSSVATNGLQGSLYIRTGALGGKLYQKQDNGSSTNWTLLAAGSGTAWGTITGTLSDQVDLQSALDAKFTLPALTAGSVLFSDGTTIDQDNANFFWDVTNKFLSIGTTVQNTNNGSVQIVTAKTDPSNAMSGYIADLTPTFTADSTATVIGMSNFIKPKVDAGVSNHAALLNHFSGIGRQDFADQGTVDLAGSYFAQFVDGNGPKHTGQYTAYLAGFHSIDNTVTIGDLYDFQALPSSIPAGVVGNRYGIFVNPDPNYVKHNWLSGDIVLGGSSYSSPTTTLDVRGNMIAAISLTDNGAIAIEGSSSSSTTVDGSNATVGIQSVASATVDATFTNDKSAAGAINTVTRGNSGDDGTLSAMAGNISLLFHNPGAGGHTTETYGNAVLHFLQNGTQDTIWDYFSQTIPAGSGVATVHYGLYLAPDPTVTKLNWVAGNTQLGGNSLSAPTDVLEVRGSAKLIDGHLKSNQTTAPVGTVNVNAGTGATCDVANATDVAGTVTLVTTNIASASGDQCDIVFNAAYGVAPICTFSPMNADAVLQSVVQGEYFTSSVSQATINFANLDAVGHTFQWAYHCIETQ